MAVFGCYLATQKHFGPVRCYDLKFGIYTVNNFIIHTPCKLGKSMNNLVV